MRRLKWVVLSLLLLAGGNAWGHDAKLQAELLDEVLSLSHADVPDDIILEQINAWGFVFELTADDIVELRTLGVSDAVIRALVQTAGWEVDEALVTRPRVYFSAGFYSPWYYFPYAWGRYCDPFPRLYACYYYPFYYRVSFGYYGWCGSTYYAHYYPRAWHRQAWRNGGRRGAQPYNVVSRRPARPADRIVVPGSKKDGSGGAASPRVIRGSRERHAATTLQRGSELRTATGRSARRAPATGPPRTVQRGRLDSRSPVLQPRQGREARRVQTPTWRRDGSRSRTLDRALPRQRSWSAPRAARGRAVSSPSRSGLRASSPSRFQSSPRMQSMPRSAPRAISSHFGAARSR